MRIVLFCMLLLFMGCGKSVNHVEKSLMKKLKKIETVSDENRDSLELYINNMGVAIREAGRLENSMFISIVKAEEQYGISRDSLDAIVAHDYSQYRQKLKEAVDIRYAMRNFLTESEWVEFCDRKVKKDK